MRILILSYHIPPDPAVGTLRVARVAEAFRRAGHEVELIGPRTDDAAALEPGVHRVSRWRNPRELALALRDRLRRRKQVRQERSSAAPAAGGWVLREDVPGWKRFLVAMALMPDDHQGFILPAATRAMRLIRQRRIDLLYTTGPPHSAHVAGLLAKLVTGVRWAAEFRDPWTDNAVQPRYARSEAAAAMKRWLERTTLRHADHVIAVSEAAGRLFSGKLPGLERRVIIARNGIDIQPSVLTDVVRDRRPDRATSIVYIGNLYHSRDPLPFLTAVASLVRQGAIAEDRVRIDFYGDCEIYRGGNVRRLAEDLGLSDIVRLHGRIPQEEAVRRAAEADVLLLLAQEQPLQIPNKLYEYLGTGRPILAFADGDGETAEMLRRVGGHFLVTSGDPEHVRSVVAESLTAAEWTPTPGTEEVLAGWSAQRQMDELVRRLTGEPGLQHAARDRSPARSHANDSLLHARHADQAGSR